MQNLVNSGDVVVNQEDFFWYVFPTDSASSGCTESNTFAELAKIYNMENVPASLPATSRLVLNPDRAPYSQRTHQTRPDAVDGKPS